MSRDLTLWRSCPLSSLFSSLFSRQNPSRVTQARQYSQDPVGGCDRSAFTASREIYSSSPLFPLPPHPRMLDQKPILCSTITRFMSVRTYYGPSRPLPHSSHNFPYITGPHHDTRNEDCHSGKWNVSCLIGAWEESPPTSTQYKVHLHVPCSLMMSLFDKQFFRNRVDRIIVS